MTAPDPHSPAPPVIDVRGAHKSFGTVTAVAGVDLTIPRGQVAALLGVNGAGKTTLIDLALGLQHPTHGSARLFGLAPRDAIRRGLVGVVHQSGALLPDYTVDRTLRLFAATHTRSLDLDALLDLTALTGLARRRVGRLSGGERQRLRLALALLPDPDLLILDEPTAGMDAVARRAFWALMRDQADEGRTIVFATHYLAEAQDFAERTIIMSDGRVLRDGPTDEIRAETRTRRLSIHLPRTSRPDAEAALTRLADSPSWRVRWDDEETPGSSPDALVSVEGRDLDDAARALLAIPGAHDLHLTTATLEDAFAALVQTQE
ncbi:ABC transporter ATP-binding protein [Actinomyces sp. B33]|uniref:ABC transporter ATP-binding protein n=1 Tax=Actinomyces sp. B33 TaxID=2942131 RepID=UPI002341A2BE|nr:ABC transporter ATP-binding protein [Actinomyces sp. B33]MDC4232421.1 ABC transporter ATP-binding protein [Actinomyces sp. B33]